MHLQVHGADSSTFSAFYHNNKLGLSRATLEFGLGLGSVGVGLGRDWVVVWIVVGHTKFDPNQI